MAIFIVGFIVWIGGFLIGYGLRGFVERSRTRNIIQDVKASLGIQPDPRPTPPPPSRM